MRAGGLAKGACRAPWAAGTADADRGHVLVQCLANTVVAFALASSVVSAAEHSAAKDAARSWDPALLCLEAAWPHDPRDARVAATPRGLRVEVPEGRKYAIAAVSELALPDTFGRVQVRVSERGGGATWFVRIYGELRQSGTRHTLGIAQGQAEIGEWTFSVDPRSRRLRGLPLQLQLGVEGEPGAFAVFEDVTFLPTNPRANLRPRIHRQAGQVDIEAVESMPNLPEPYELLDWKAKAQAYDRFVFDFDARGEYLPLVWIDELRINIDRPTFGLPSYVGDSRQRGKPSGEQEGITCMGAVLGATIAGIDKSLEAHDWVDMCEAWFNARNGLDLVLNTQRQETGGSFWYELWPHIVFCAISDRYPKKSRLAEIQRITADRWLQVCRDLADSKGIPDFDHTAFDFRTRKPVDNGRWKEPDAAAGVAWLQFAAWKRFGRPEYLAAAGGCIRFLEGLKGNPYYEVLLPYGALVAARMKAELGRTHDAGRLLEQSFGISDSRGGWGVTLGNWGGRDCDGLVGSIDDRGGYAFAMNTFAQAGALVPFARYDTRRARAIGKWMLNLANAARYFYPGSLPASHQTSGEWQGDPGHVIAYEGLRREWQGKSPCATGDPVAMNWGPKTDLGLYGSGYVGILGGLVRATDVRGVLLLDGLATDFFRDPAYPTFLCYNPHPEARSVEIDVGEGPRDIFDAVTREFLCRGARGRAKVTIPLDSAVVLVLAPAGGTLERRGSEVRIDGVIAAYATGDR